MGMRLRALGAGLLFAAFGVFLAVNYGPDLLNDIAVQHQRSIAHPKARIVSANCTRYLYAISACEVEYTEPVSASERSQFRERSVLRILMFGSAAKKRISLLQPESRPDMVTSDAGLQLIANRAGTLLSLLLICLGLASVIVHRLLSREATPFEGEPEADLHKVDAAITHQLQVSALRAAMLPQANATAAPHAAHPAPDADVLPPHPPFGHRGVAH